MRIRKLLSRGLMALCMVGVLALTGCGAADDGADRDVDTSSKVAGGADVSGDEDTGSSSDSGNDGNAASEADNEASKSQSATGYSFNGKSFVVTLYPEIAPIPCANFQKLVEQGFYNGLTFHRFVDAFMAQGGDPLGNGTGGSEETIKGEFASNGVDNGISHQRGVISMARSQDPDSASSQFFICYADCTFLDGDYAAFGEVTEGMEVVDGFLEVPRSMGGDGAVSAPDDNIVMDKVEMIEPDANGNPRVQVTMK